MYGYHCSTMKKLRTLCKYVWFSLLYNEKENRKLYKYVWCSFTSHGKTMEIIHIYKIFKVLPLKNNENHTYLQFVLSSFNVEQWKSYIFTTFFRLLRVWILFARPQAHWIVISTQTCPDHQNLENLVNMYGFYYSTAEKHGKPYEYVWFSLFYNETT